MLRVLEFRTGSERHVEPRLPATVAPANPQVNQDRRLGCQGAAGKGSGDIDGCEAMLRPGVPQVDRLYGGQLDPVAEVLLVVRCEGRLDSVRPRLEIGSCRRTAGVVPEQVAEDVRVQAVREVELRLNDRRGWRQWRHGIAKQRVELLVDPIWRFHGKATTLVSSRALPPCPVQPTPQPKAKINAYRQAFIVASGRYVRIRP